MTKAEQIRSFTRDIDTLLRKYRNEYDLSYAEVVGALQAKTHLMLHEALEHAEDPDEDENDP